MNRVQCNTWTLTAQAISETSLSILSTALVMKSELSHSKYAQKTQNAVLSIADLVPPKCNCKNWLCNSVVSPATGHIDSPRPYLRLQSTYNTEIRIVIKNKQICTMRHSMYTWPPSRNWNTVVFTWSKLNHLWQSYDTKNSFGIFASLTFQRLRFSRALEEP